MAVVILGCVFLGFRLFTDIGSQRVLSALEVQQEEISIERRTLCVQVFWEIAAVLQSGEEPDPSLRCEENSRSQYNYARSGRYRSQAS